MVDPRPDERPPDDGATPGEQPGALRRFDDFARDRSMAPMAAMAEALRANAEALRRIDQNQQKMADRIARTDRSQNVIASTRALNETFRGLSEIQRGLLDALVTSRRGASGAGRGLSAALLLLVALLAGALGFLFAERWLARDTVPRAAHEEARRAVDALRGEKADLVARLRDAEGAGTALERRLAEERAGAASLDQERGELRARIDELKEELASKSARLEEYLAVKAQADLAGQLRLDNMALQQENRELKERLTKLESEERRLLGYFGERLQELGGHDPEAMMEVARKLGIVEEPGPVPGQGADAAGSEALAGSRKRLFLDEVNRLFPDAEEAYAILDVGSVEGARFRDVTLTRHLGSQLVGTLEAKELVIRADPARDTLELALVDGFLATTRPGGEKIPFGEDGHYVYLSEVGLGDWLRRTRRFELDPKGRLTWKSSDP